MFGRVLENVLVGGGPPLARVAFQEPEARRATQPLFKMVHVGLPDLLLFGQALELGCEQRGLKLGDAIVEPDKAMAVFVRGTGAAAVGERLGALEEFEVAGNNCAAFAGSHQFARLKAEATQVAGGPCSLRAPFAAMSVGAVLNHHQVVGARDAADLIQVGKAHGKVDGQNGARLRREPLFDQAASRQYVSGSTSTKTGTAFKSRMGPTVPSQV